MRPKLEYDGGIFPLTSLWYNEDGRIGSVSFMFGEKLKTVFRGDEGVDFENNIIWEETE